MAAGHGIPPLSVHVQVCHVEGPSSELRCASCIELLVVEHSGEGCNPRQGVGR
ncbi:hypothetical protein STAFG_7626 [Streptomyces afghaniensis 772]|uniref:Uncharacterized protein n=1 Tax=Streptomyces afghaniensis 772 TaxID=1283301 RepID=S4MFU0_9ACTN|nr:hypothetical protein STAFG_7626 [Streptomyces afghaniensis 772]